MENTSSLAEATQELMALIATRDSVKENLDKSIVDNSYLVMVVFDLERAVKNLADRIRQATSL